jgi:hypothetical protein
VFVPVLEFLVKIDAAIGRESSVLDESVVRELVGDPLLDERDPVW